MNLFEKRNIEKQEYIDCLKDIICNVLNEDVLKNIAYSKDCIETIKSDFTESASDDFEKEYGISTNDILLFLQFTVFNSEHILPLVSAMEFLRFTDIGDFIDDRSWQELINQPLDELPDWNYVFDILTKIPSRISKFYIAQLECSNEQQYTLAKTITEKDSESFISCIYKLGKESWPLKHVADIYNMVLSMGSLSEFSKNEFSKGTNIKEFVEINVPSVIKKDKLYAYLNKAGLYDYYSKVKLLNGNSAIESIVEIIQWENIGPLYRHAMGSYLCECEIFRLEKENLYPEVQELLSQFIIDPEQIEFYHELKKRGITINIAIKADDGSIDNTEPKAANLSEHDVFLPADFFKIQNRRRFEKAIGVIANKYTDKIENAVPKFCELINFLAERKYIKNDLVVKKDFASKITGYYPEFNQLEKIDWFGDTNVLSVLIQNLPSSENKWERAKKLFNLENKLYNSSTLRKNNPDDQDFADKFEEIYGVNLRE